MHMRSEYRSFSFVWVGYMAPDSLTALCAPGGGIAAAVPEADQFQRAVRGFAESMYRFVQRRRTACERQRGIRRCERSPGHAARLVSGPGLPCRLLKNSARLPG